MNRRPQATQTASLGAWTIVILYDRLGGVFAIAAVIDHFSDEVVWKLDKTFFSAMMSPQAIESAIREAYRYSDVVSSSAETLVLRGSGGGYTIEMIFDRVTGIIKTAYPV